ncbi:LemA family protein [Ruminococcus gauvreauii]|uniref:LemA family protein n=1 Tax=Ruminococcus gauvreauii TaxID=438033 RepID=A0ABY5VD89_9FIRM|nr:LemA family protein [Ruminococcus gauvreauii]UWP57908.1 LemA family protein [Ruminococcus gauvreauii]
MIWIIIIIASIIILVSVLWWIRTGNSFKRMDIKISESLSGIEVALTKRYDMLTKLLDVVNGFASHEKEVLYEVLNLRKEMTIHEMTDVTAKMDEMELKVNVVAESYPELRSSDVFRELQRGIRDAEEHLQAARRLYNSSVSGYNQSITIFPSSIVAKSMHCMLREFFEAKEDKRFDVQMKF